MEARYIPENTVAILFERLRRYGELHAPVRGDDGVVRFAELLPGSIPDLSAVRTALPPKKYLLHPRDTILTYTPCNGYQNPPEITRPLILLGLHPCDLAGINYLDRIFLIDEPDPLYSKRRSALTLIGISCTPDTYCSCHRVPSPLEAAYDLFLTPLGNGFAVSSGSARGDILMDGMMDISAEYSACIPEDTRRYFGHKDLKSLTRQADAAIPGLQELAGRCLGCGACSICCPTCSCFDVLEFAGLDGRTAVRVRQWDNCLFKRHDQLAGGVSLRKDQTERFQCRYRHKYLGFGMTHRINSCVGCGRCRVFCPAEIDIRPLAEQQERRSS